MQRRTRYVRTAVGMAASGLLASVATASDVLFEAENANAVTGLARGECEFENPLGGHERVLGHEVLEWRDADYHGGSDYEDWSTTGTSSGCSTEVWLRSTSSAGSTTTSVASTAVSIHLHGDGNDGLADVYVDDVLVAQLDMYSPWNDTDNVIVLVWGLSESTHVVRVQAAGSGSGSGHDVAIFGAAAVSGFYVGAVGSFSCSETYDSEDFGGFLVDMPFSMPGGLPIGASMDLEAFFPVGFRNVIDTEDPNYLFTDNNGTSHASCFTNAETMTEVEIRFNALVAGFGCDLYSPCGGEIAELVVFREDEVVGVLQICSSTMDVDMAVGYRGEIDRVRFRSATTISTGGVGEDGGGTLDLGEGFGLDDIVVCGPVQTPPDEIGTTPPTCIPNPNGTGQPARISAFGSTSASDQDVRLYLENVPLAQFGIFIVSNDLAPVPFIPPGSAGFVCLGGNIGRYREPGQVFVGEGLGTSVPPGGFQVGDIAVPVFPPVSAITGGDTWNWQAWYRENPTSNFSSTVQVIFAP